MAAPVAVRARPRTGAPGRRPRRAIASVSSRSTSGPMWSQPSGVPLTLACAVDQVQPGFAGTRYGALFDKVAELLSDDDHARLVIVTDMQRTGFDGGMVALADGVELILRDVGAPAGNLSVVDARADAGHVTATVLNAGGGPRAVDVRLETSGQVRSTRQRDHSPGDVGRGYIRDRAIGPVRRRDRRRRRLPCRQRSLCDHAIADAAARAHRRAAGRRRGDGFYLVARAPGRGRGRGADFDVRTVTGIALRGMTARSCTISPSWRCSPRTASIAASASRFARFSRAAAALHCRRRGRRSRGPVGLLDWQPPLRSSATCRAAGVLAATDLRHPVFSRSTPSPRTSDRCRSSASGRSTPGRLAGRREIYRWGGGAPRASAGRGRILLFTSDLDRRWNDFPLHPIVRAVRAGTCALSWGARARHRGLPRGRRSAGRSRQARLRAAGGRTLAINVDPRESTVDRVGPAEFSRLVTRTSADTKASASVGQLTEAKQQYWHYGLMLMLGVL